MSCSSTVHASERFCSLVVLHFTNQSFHQNCQNQPFFPSLEHSDATHFVKRVVLQMAPNLDEIYTKHRRLRRWFYNVTADGIEYSSCTFFNLCSVILHLLTHPDWRTPPPSNIVTSCVNLHRSSLESLQSLARVSGGTRKRMSDFHSKAFTFPCVSFTGCSHARFTASACIFLSSPANFSGSVPCSVCSYARKSVM